MARKSHNCTWKLRDTANKNQWDHFKKWEESYRKIIGSLDSVDIQAKNFYFYPMYINGKYKERQPDGILETFYVTHPISTNLGNITSG